MDTLSTQTNSAECRDPCVSLGEAAKIMVGHISDPTKGLPEEAFLLVSRLTPMVNVDLLIKDENGRTLLSWRNDSFGPAGWHVPGGIVRFKEKLEDRVRKVSESEIGVMVEYESIPASIDEIIVNDRCVRGHFISILYKCFLHGSFIPKNDGLSRNDQGYLKWHDYCPVDLIEHHRIYRHLI